MSKEYIVRDARGLHADKVASMLQTRYVEPGLFPQVVLATPLKKPRKKLQTVPAIPLAAPVHRPMDPTLVVSQLLNGQGKARGFAYGKLTPRRPRHRAPAKLDILGLFSERNGIRGRGRVLMDDIVKQAASRMRGSKSSSPRGYESIPKNAPFRQSPNLLLVVPQKECFQKAHEYYRKQDFNVDPKLGTIVKALRKKTKRPR